MTWSAERAHCLNALLNGFLTAALCGGLVMHGSGAFADEGWTLDIRKRQEERRKEKWYFSEHLNFKNESNRLDLLYRLLLGQREPRARVELIAYGLGVAVRQTHEAAYSSQEHVVTGLGYGGRLALNNFVAVLTGWRLPNVVPNVFGEAIETEKSGSSSSVRVQRFGAGLRFFGSNPEDTALYADYARRRLALVAEKSPSVLGGDGYDPGTYESWVVDLSAQLYLFPSLGLTGGWVLPKRFVSGHETSPVYELSEIRGGAQLDLSLIRLGYEHAQRIFKPKEGTAAGQVKQVEHLVRIGFLF